MPCLIYLTAPSLEMARQLAEILVKERLAACVNIFPTMYSVYRWQNQIEHTNEVVMVVKTVKEHFKAIESLVIKHHPYNCPCILLLDIQEGHKHFLTWISDEVCLQEGTSSCS